MSSVTAFGQRYLPRQVRVTQVQPGAHLVPLSVHGHRQDRAVVLQQGLREQPGIVPFEFLDDRIVHRLAQQPLLPRR